MKLNDFLLLLTEVCNDKDFICSFGSYCPFDKRCVDVTIDDWRAILTEMCNKAEEEKCKTT